MNTDSISRLEMDGGDGRKPSLLGRALALAAIALLLALATLALAAHPAAAAPKPMAGFIGQEIGTAGGLFAQPRDVAVYTGADSDPANDKLFVVEGSESAGNGNSRVQRLDRHGNLELMWGKNVVQAGAPGDTGSGYEVCSEAVSGVEGCKNAPHGSAPGEFANPHGIAVNQSTGHVYVIDRYNFRVQEFDLDGGFVRAWGWGVASGAENFEVCTSSCRQGLPGSGDGQFAGVPDILFADAFPGTGIAVDPANGDVFVADPASNRVQQFSATGAFLAKFGSPGAGLGEFGERQPRRLTVDSNHIVYVGDTNESNRVQRYDADADAFLAPIACCGPAPEAPLAEGTTVGLEIDPDTDGGGPDEEHLLVARERTEFDQDTVIQELDIPTPATDPIVTVVEAHIDEVDPAASTRNLIDRVVSGIGISATTGDLYAVKPHINSAVGQGTFTGCSGSSCSGLLVLSSASGTLASALTGADAAATSAALTGTANAGGGVASYRFELSTDDGASWQDTGVRGYVSGLDDVPIAREIAGLEPNTAYRVRLVVRKQTGHTTDSTEISNDLSFTTDTVAPDVETLGATQLTVTGARLRGRVDPNGLEASYRFEYGLAGGPFDRQAPLIDGSAGSGNAPLLLTADVGDLLPETTYHYRLVATNSVGTTVGETVVFATRAPAPVLPPLDRAYELVSPADKVGGVGAGRWGTGAQEEADNVGVAAHEGERFAVSGQLGSVLMNGAYAYASDWALAERTPVGWVSRPGASRRAYGPQPKTFLEMMVATEDLSLMAFSSNSHTVKFFPEMEAWDENRVGAVLFVRQWNDDAFELFGPLDPSQIAQSTLFPATAFGPPALAADGSAVVAQTDKARGLAGPGDPTILHGGNAIYRDEILGPFSDDFPGDDGVRTLVNVCTGAVGTADRTELPSGPCPAPEPGTDERLIPGSLGDLNAGKQVISANGSRVFFESSNGLFVWQRGLDGKAATRWISRTEVTAANGAAAEQAATLMAPVSFEGASREGDKVFFSTAAPLTADDRNGGGTPPAGGVTEGEAEPLSRDLYMYDLPDGPDGDPARPDADPVGGDLVRVSAGPDGDGDCNTPADTARFLSADGSRVYFTCAAPLPGVEVPGDGTSTTPGGTRATTTAMNLYMYDGNRPPAERWRFVARLSKGANDCATVTKAAQALHNCVKGVADGSFVKWFTHAALTEDDPDEVSGDVYAYDAQRDELSRVSRPQGGLGGAYDCGGGFLQCYADPGKLSGAVKRLGIASRPADGDASGDPHREKLTFFQSRARLVPEDENDAFDVYQWRARDGTLSLISTGDPGAGDTMFVGNDRSGLNVYIATLDRLTWQDRDAVLDVYTARIGGGFPEPVTPPACVVLDDGCQGAPAPAPAPLGASSGAFQGPGNAVERPRRGKPRVRKCAAGKARRKGRCVSKRQGNQSEKSRRAGR